ncbi:MAG: LOG family protein [Acidobacteriota bacterium]
MGRPVILGVMGAGGDGAPPGSSTYALAEALGEAVGRAGALLLNGGGDGTMEASAIGARRAGGQVIGVLRAAVEEPSEEPPAGLDLALFTGLGDGRNFLNISIADAVIALPGGAGTLSEIALALKARKRFGKPVIALGAWQFLIDRGYDLVRVDQPQDAVQRAFAMLGLPLGDRIDAPIAFPEIPDQRGHRDRLRHFVSR